MDYRGKKAVVCGAGISGIGAVHLLINKGATVCVFDELKSKVALDEVLSGDLKDVKGAVGTFPEEFYDCDIMIVSPGVSINKDFVKKFESLGKKVMGEVEFAYDCSEGRLIAITGTNGKTTTTSMVGEILENYFESSFVVGNIGNAYTLEADKMNKDSVTVAEISSFQMECAKEFHPQVSCVLNITEDHLDRHKTMENYIACKMNVCMNQTEDEVCVLNYEDAILREEAKKLKCKVVYYSSAHKLDNGYFFDNGIIYKAEDGKCTELLKFGDMNIVGTHNAENTMAAIAVTDAIGVPMDKIVEAVKNFKAVAHRIEFVREFKGVKYYNDSKGTNPDASIKAVEAMDGPVILIAGGYDKELPFDEFCKCMIGRVKLLVLVGQTAGAIKEEAIKTGITNIYEAKDFEEAVNVCVENAVSGDRVLLSPACASWGMFDNYVQRGNLFKDLVNNLK